MSIDIRRRQRCDTRVAIKTKPTPHQLPRRGGSASLMWVQYKSTFYYCFNYNFSPVSDSLSLPDSPFVVLSLGWPFQLVPTYTPSNSASFAKDIVLFLASSAFVVCGPK